MKNDLNADQLPLTVLVPETIERPVEVFDRHAALRIAIVEYGGEKHISSEWESTGVYLLIGRLDENHEWTAYVGKATELLLRIRNHTHKKWDRALLVRRDTTYGFNSADIGWLEGRLYEMLDTAENAKLVNKQKPGDETLPPYDKQMLEQVVLPVQRLLRLLGYDPSPRGDPDSPSKAQSKSNRYYGVELRQITEAGILAPGSTLTSTNGAWPAEARVTKNGKVEVHGKQHSSPSAAAQAVKGGGSANGWDFWAFTTPGGNRKTLALLRKEYEKAMSQTR